MIDDKNKSSLFSNDRFKGYTWLSWFKDFIIIILLMLLVFSFSNSAKVVESLGLIGTFASLALAVVAILYAFEQSRGQESNTDKINNVVNDLKNISLAIARDTTNLNKSTVDVVNNFTKLGDLFENIQEIQRNTKDSKLAISGMMHILDHSRDKDEDGSVHVAMVVYALKKIAESSKSSYTEAEFANLIARCRLNDDDHEQFTEEVYSCFFHGVLQPLISLRLIEFSNGSVTILNEEKLNSLFQCSDQDTSTWTPEARNGLDDFKDAVNKSVGR